MTEMTQSRILFVEDEKMLREAIMRLLTSAGYECDVAEDGERGLASLRERSYALVITDIGMPRMNGHEMLSTARQTGLRLPPIIVLSGLRDHSDEVREAAGANVFLSKPVSGRTLREHIQGLL